MTQHLQKEYARTHQLNQRTNLRIMDIEEGEQYKQKEFVIYSTK
jgi:hypothetical protein